MSDAEFRRALVATLPRMRKLAHALCGAPADSDDLLQAAMERALQRQDQCRDSSRIEAWVASMVRSVWKNELRSRQVRRGNGITDVEVLRDASLSAQPDRMCQFASLAEQVAALPEEQRQVVILVDIEGMSYRETAEVLDLPTGTVMSRLARARDRLMQTASAANAVSDIPTSITRAPVAMQRGHTESC